MTTPFETILGHEFARPDLLREALTHRSAAQGRHKRGGSNERLEFVGDRVLGLLIAELADRGASRASRKRRTGGAGWRILVSQPVLAEVAKSISGWVPPCRCRQVRHAPG